MTRELLTALVPTLVFVVGTVVGGWINTIDLHGRVVDDYTGDGIVATLTHGSRAVTSADDGSFVFPDLPRQSVMRADARGYQRMTVPTTDPEIRMHPLALTLYVHEAGNEKKLIPKVEVREGGKRIAITNDSGNTVLSPHPGPGTSITLCASGYEPKTVPARGVLLIVGLDPGPTGCPPLG